MTKTFDDAFKNFYPVIQKMAKHYANKTPIPEEEFESQFCETFFLQYDKYDHKRGGFTAFMRVILQQEGMRLATRKERRFYDAITTIDLPEDDEEERGYPVELIADVDIEEEVFDVMFVEEQLAKADDDTRKVLEAFFNDPRASFRDIGRTTGVEHKRVRRLLEKVALGVRSA